MTVVDWMFAHPWMTFFILFTLASSIGSWFRPRRCHTCEVCE